MMKFYSKIGEKGKKKTETVDCLKLFLYTCTYYECVPCIAGVGLLNVNALFQNTVSRIAKVSAPIHVLQSCFSYQHCKHNFFLGTVYFYEQIRKLFAMRDQ